MKASGYNIMRDDIALLEEHERSSPSFSVHLYPAHWTLNNGPKFLYNNQVSSILEDIRAFRIPTDFIQIFDDAGVPYYDGCLIVELLDYRPAKAKDPVLEKPDIQRVVLRPNPETIWADICIMNAKAGMTLTDVEALEIEARLLLSTSTPLCLDPEPRLTRVVNSILRVSTPNVPNSLKRKAAAMVDLEEDETEKAKRAKIMQYMSPQANTARKPFHPSYKILMLMEQRRSTASQQSQQQPQQPSTDTVPVTLPVNTQTSNLNGVAQGSQDSTKAMVAFSLQEVAVAPINPARYGVSQRVSTTMPPIQMPMHSQQAVGPSQRKSPAKQQQQPDDLSPQRPPSQPISMPQPGSTNPQQAQGQTSQQAVPFNPPIPPSNFLNPPPAGKRRLSVAAKPGTPTVPRSPLPVQQAPNQSQLQPGSLTPVQPQPQAQLQTQQAHHVQQLPLNMTLQNMTQYFQNGRALPMTAQAAAAVIAQRQAQSGRSTPANANNPRPSPAPASAMARSPMLPAAAAAAMISRRNTPVATSPQVARGSPLAANQPVVVRNIAGQVQQQPQQSVMLQSGTQANQAYQQMRFQQQQQQQQQLQAYMRAQAVQAQGQVGMTQGRVTPAQAGTAQAQQPSPGQAAAAQTFTGVQISPQMYYNMQMNMNLQQPHQYLAWQQRMMGRGVPQMASHMQNGQQQMAVMPPGMTLQQMQGLGRAMPGSLQNR